MFQRTLKEKVYPKNFKSILSFRKKKTINKQINKKETINIFVTTIIRMTYLCDIINDQYAYLRDSG